MDERPSGSAATTSPVQQHSRPVAKRIGFIGKAQVSDYEAACLTYIGKCIAALGHTLVSVEAPGAETALRMGVEAQEGSVDRITAGVLDNADRSLLYPDPYLLERIKKKYPDLEQREDIVLIAEDQLDEWVDAMKSILDEYGIDRP